MEIFSRSGQEVEGKQTYSGETKGRHPERKLDVQIAVLALQESQRKCTTKRLMGKVSPIVM